MTSNTLAPRRRLSHILISELVARGYEMYGSGELASGNRIATSCINTSGKLVTLGFDFTTGRYYETPIEHSGRFQTYQQKIAQAQQEKKLRKKEQRKGIIHRQEFD